MMQIYWYSSGIVLIVGGVFGKTLRQGRDAAPSFAGLGRAEQARHMESKAGCLWCAIRFESGTRIG